MFNLFKIKVPIYIFILLFIVILFFLKFNFSNPSSIKHQIDTVYVDVKEIKYDTIYLTKIVKVETKPEIETDNKKKTFTIKNEQTIDSLSFIKSKTTIFGLSDFSFKELKNLSDKGMIKNSFEYRLPTIEKTKIVPLYTSKQEACLYQLKGSLITLGIQAAIISSAIIIYNILK